MPPAWLTALAWAALAVAFASTAWIAYDIYGRGYRRQMRIMEVVRPVTGLYFGPAAVAACRAWGARRARAGSTSTVTLRANRITRSPRPGCRGAPQPVTLGLLEDHLAHCVAEAVAEGGDVAAALDEAGVCRLAG